MTLFKGKFLALFVILVSINLHAEESIQEVIDHFLPGVKLEDLLRGQEEVTLTEAEPINKYKIPFTESELAEANVILNKYETLKRRLIAREYVLREILKMKKSEGLHSADPIVHEFIGNGVFDVLSLYDDLAEEFRTSNDWVNPFTWEMTDVITLTDRVLLREKELLDWQRQNSKNTTDKTDRLFIDQGEWPGVIRLLGERRILKFHQAVEGRNHAAVAKLLKENAVDIINAPDREGRTASYKAAVEGDFEMVGLLMENDAVLFLSDSQHEKTPDVVLAKIRETYKKAQELRERLGKDGTAVTLCGY